MKSTLYSLAVVTTMGLLVACSERPKEYQQGGTLESGSAPQAEARVRTAEELDNILQIEEAIAANPQSDSLYRLLVQNAVDEAGDIWSVGKGKIPGTAASPNIAQSMATRAATIDAARWAAYVLEWQETDYATPFGSIDREVPGYVTVRSSLRDDSTMIVILRTPVKK